MGGGLGGEGFLDEPQGVAVSRGPNVHVVTGDQWKVMGGVTSWDITSTFL